MLGEHGAITIDAARERARRWLELIGKGIDPKIDEARRKAEERRKAVNIFEAVAKEYLARHAALAKHGEVKRILEAVFIKPWGERPAGDVLTEEVADAFRAIVKRGAPYQARRATRWAISCGSIIEPSARTSLGSPLRLSRR
jgi:hypothetical protein